MKPGDLVRWTVLKWRVKQPDEPDMGMLISYKPFNDDVVEGQVLRLDGKVVTKYLEKSKNPV